MSLFNFWAPPTGRSLGIWPNLAEPDLDLTRGPTGQWGLSSVNQRGERLWATTSHRDQTGKAVLGEASWLGGTSPSGTVTPGEGDNSSSRSLWITYSIQRAFKALPVAPHFPNIPMRPVALMYLFTNLLNSFFKILII